MSSSHFSPRLTDEGTGPREQDRGSQATLSISGRAGIKSQRSGPSGGWALTLAGAEAELAVGVVVGGGAAPEHVVGTAVRGAGRVGATLEGEGEVAGGALRVSEVGRDHCGKGGLGSEGLVIRVRGEGSGDRGSSGSHQRLCPETTTLHRRSGHLPECLRQAERRVPGARSFHRRDTHLHALKKRVEKRVRRVRLCRLCTAQGRWPNYWLKFGLRAAIQHLLSQCSEVSVRRGRHKGDRAPGLRGQAREIQVQGPLSSLFDPPTSVPISDSPDFPLLRVLTSNTKLDDNVSFGAVHSSEGERRHRAPERESAGKGVVDHVARQVFRVILDPGGKRQEDKGQK